MCTMDAPEERRLRRFGETAATRLLQRLTRDGAPPFKTSMSVEAKTFYIDTHHGVIELERRFVGSRFSIRVRHHRLGLMGWAVAGRHGNFESEGPIKQAFVLLERLATAQNLESEWGQGEREILDDLVA